MKILQITPHYYPFYGGVEEVVKQYSERLAANHQDKLSVLTALDQEAPAKEILNGVEITRLPNMPEFITQVHKLNQFPFVFNAVSKKISQNFDVYHLHANKRFLTDTAAYLLNQQQKRFVFNPHAGQFGKSILGRIHNQTIGKLAFKAAKVIVVSDFERKLLFKHGIKDNVEVLPNGVDLQEFKKVRPNYLSNFELAGRTKLLFVGRMATSKGVDLLPLIAAKIVKDIPEIVFIVVGKDAGAKNDLQSKIKGAKLEKNFLILENLDRDNLISIYQNSDIFVLPTRSEAFGVVLIEAMAAGLPIVASHNSAVPEIIDDQDNGLLAGTNNVSDFAKKITFLIKEKNESKKISKNALHTSLNYGWDEIVKRLHKIYEEVI